MASDRRPPTPATFPYTAEFFVGRSPLLPVACVREGVNLVTPESDDVALDAAVTVDITAIQACYTAILKKPVVREALWLNSPDLVFATELWLRDPNHPSACNVLGSLYRYLMRMSHRPTPFGLSAGLSTGTIGERTVLRLDGGLWSHTRLDNAWLTALTDALEPMLRDGLTYRANSSLYRSADQLRYAGGRGGLGGDARHT